MEKKEFEKSKASIIKNTLDYSEGAVVSKTLLNKETGTVTLFSFDRGQGLSEHTAPYDALVQIIEGEAYIIINKKDYKLSEGHFIIMPANVPHAVHAKENFKMLLTLIKSS